jgi:hypothetical protein
VQPQGRNAIKQVGHAPLPRPDRIAAPSTGAGHFLGRPSRLRGFTPTCVALWGPRAIHPAPTNSGSLVVS